MRISASISVCLLASLFLSGCTDSKDPVVYTIPKENISAPPVVETSAPVMDMARQQLPESALNRDGENPAWVVPTGWEVKAGSAMRRASFSASGNAGAADIAVTSFPGDVGGLLANLNRWRGQIGAPTLAQSEIEASIERLTINGKEAIISEITGTSQSTHAAIFEHEGQSWFFKMTGPSATINEQAGAFRAFVESVAFPVGSLSLPDAY